MPAAAENDRHKDTESIESASERRRHQRECLEADPLAAVFRG